MTPASQEATRSRRIKPPTSHHIFTRSESCFRTSTSRSFISFGDFDSAIRKLGKILLDVKHQNQNPINDLDHVSHQTLRILNNLTSIRTSCAKDCSVRGDERLHCTEPSFKSQVKATSVKKKAPCPRPILLYVFLGGIGEVPLDFHTDIPT